MDLQCKSLISCAFKTFDGRQSLRSQNNACIFSGPEQTAESAKGKCEGWDLFPPTCKPIARYCVAITTACRRRHHLLSIAAGLRFARPSALSTCSYCRMITSFETAYSPTNLCKVLFARFVVRPYAVALGYSIHVGECLMHQRSKIQLPIINRPLDSGRSKARASRFNATGDDFLVPKSLISYLSKNRAPARRITPLLLIYSPKYQNNTISIAIRLLSRK